MSPSRPDVITGLNFASGSCGILPETGSPYGICLKLEDQVNLFERTAVNDLPEHFNGSNDISDYLSKSIFALTVGSNDYINNYLEPNLFDTSRSYPPNAFSQILIGNLSDHLRRLFDLGARKFVVFEIGPIGCIPSITRKSNHSGLCVDESNRLVSIFNGDLREMLRNMTVYLRGSAFVLGEANWLGYDAIIHPPKYGRSNHPHAK
ncbi:hypothetical protein CDL15_Pgr020449 [Punica granatum]|uniref:GDSL esterase/lipase 7-like n=1 Tax=Punica granatum TaxID=22663 RepID=A0A218VX88_PUNGR|nr:hypothetical protein CDL15_Pgr020449 [Punica granatum]